MFVTYSCQIPYDPNLYQELRIMQREAASVWNDMFEKRLLSRVAHPSLASASSDGGW